MGIGAGAAVGLASAAISAGTGIASAVSGGSSQSGDISAGQQQAIAAEQKAYSDYSANEQPFLSAGTNALSSYQDALGLNGASGTANALANFTASPGYQYDLGQALSAVDNGAASIGTLRSGNTVRAEEAVGAGLADQQFSAYLGRLNSLAGLGQQATSSLGSAGVTTGAGMASTDTSAATAQANITGNTDSAISKNVSSLLGNSSLSDALKGLGGGTTSNANGGVGGGTGYTSGAGNAASGLHVGGT